MSDTISIRSLSRSDWPVLERLFGPNGACGGCWCMWWRVEKGGKTYDALKGEPNRCAMRRLVKAGKVHGMLAFAGREPVGWCSFGPKKGFPRLMRARVLTRESNRRVWSLVCFYIRGRHRNSGLASRLAKAATARCFKKGAEEIEAYPVAAKNPKKRMPAAFAWTGVPPMFERIGYRKQGRVPGARPIYVKRAAQPPIRVRPKRRRGTTRIHRAKRRRGR